MDRLSSDVLNRSEFTAACADRDLGRIFALAKKWGGYSNTRLGRACELNPSRVAEYLRGQREATSARVFERVADGLGIPGALLGLERRPWEPGSPPWSPDGRSLETWELLDTITRTNISAEALAQMEHVVLTSAIRYPSTAPRTLLPSVLTMMSRLHAALSQGQSARSARRCTRLISILTGLAGNLFLDIGDHARVQSYFDVGYIAAREAEDDSLTAWVLATQSIGHTFTDRHTLAADLLERATDLVTGHGNGRREAWVFALAARAQAALGESKRTRELLDWSASALAGADAPSGIDFFDTARLQGIAGACHVRTRDTARAEPLLIDALDRRASSDVKGRALLTLDLAQCKVIDGEVEEACDLTHSALNLAAGSLVRPILDQAGSIDHDLGKWRALAPVAVLSARLRDETAALPD